MTGGGAGLKRYIHIARARAGITSDVQLALAAKISYDTLMNWFGDKTTPRPHELKKVAEALGVSLLDLDAAYEGREPEPPALTESIAAQADAIGRLVDELRLTRLAQLEWNRVLLELLQGADRGLHDGTFTARPPGTAGR